MIILLTIMIIMIIDHGQVPSMARLPHLGKRKGAWSWDYTQTTKVAMIVILIMSSDSDDVGWKSFHE